VEGVWRGCGVEHHPPLPLLTARMGTPVKGTVDQLLLAETAALAGRHVPTCTGVRCVFVCVCVCVCVSHASMLSLDSRLTVLTTRPPSSPLHQRTSRSRTSPEIEQRVAGETQREAWGTLTGTRDHHGGL